MVLPEPVYSWLPLAIIDTLPHHVHSAAVFIVPEEKKRKKNCLELGYPVSAKEEKSVKVLRRIPGRREMMT